MLDTWDQRVRRDKIVVNKISFPVPTTNLSELTDRITRAITPKTKVIHICHITNLTGQLFPVRDIARMARARGIQTIVDGAHAFAHFPFKLSRPRVRLLRLLAAQVAAGAGRHRLPLRAPREHRQALAADAGRGVRRRDNIRKFEEVGTHPAANHNAIAEALAFHQAIGTERKAARLRYLNDRWAKRVDKLPGVKILNSREPNQAWGLFNVSLERVDAPKAYDFLWSKYRIITAAIKRDDYQGLRVTPNIYTTLEEVDTFAHAIEELARNGAAPATQA